MNYELRLTGYYHLMPGSVVRIGSVDNRQWHAYSTELDGELREHEDRANEEDCWRDWWKTGRDWIKPELCEYCSEAPCIQTEDCPGGRHHERIKANYGQAGLDLFCKDRGAF